MEAIEVTKLDPKFKYEIAAQPGGDKFKRCFSCGTCTAACPAARVDDEFNPRRIIRMALLGMRKEVLSSPVLWLCTQCSACGFRCPQNVKFVDIMAALRRMAIKEGHFPEDTIEKIESLDLYWQEFRRDMVRLMFDKDSKDLEELKKSVNETLSNLGGKP